MNAKQHALLKASGFLWEFYPLATGQWPQDRQIIKDGDRDYKRKKGKVAK